MFLQIVFALLSCLLHYYINTRKKTQNQTRNGIYAKYTNTERLEKDRKLDMEAIAKKYITVEKI